MSWILLLLAAALMFIGFELMLITWWGLAIMGLAEACLLLGGWLQSRRPIV